ncbi:hypothetical protein QE152_g29962 [Popillia japonica]|uniref:Transposase n=1 Tax=Popillia japonica TaxID=7064 RepID=A0AAW1JFV6_POPJA
MDTRLYKTLTLQTPRKGTTAVVINICGTLKLAKSTVYRTIREYQRTGQLARPKARTGRHSKLQAYDESVKNGVRQIVHSFFLKNELPTLNKIMAEITRRGEPVPHMSRTTLYRFLKLINFKYVKQFKVESEGKSDEKLDYVSASPRFRS